MTDPKARRWDLDLSRQGDVSMMMQKTDLAYKMSNDLRPNLAQVLTYWEGLKRGAAEIPFWDDVNLTELAAQADRIMVLDVFEGPERFRFAVVGPGLAAGQSAPILGRFLDEIELKRPLDGLAAQCAATVAGGGPTYANTSGPGAAAAILGRLVLPLWGEGQVHMLLGVVG